MTRYRRVLFVVAVQLPLIALWTLAFLVARCGDEGRLTSTFLRTQLYPMTRHMEGAYTDLKFNVRGVRPVANKIVIIEIDDRAVREFSRWPWHRDAIAALVLQAQDAGAKVVGLDIVFPEPDQRVPDAVAELLQDHQLADQIPSFETDLVFQRIIAVYKDRIVLGWMTDDLCRPAYEGAETCPVTASEETTALFATFAKFAFTTFAHAKSFDATHTPLMSTWSLVGNLPGYVEAAKHSGFLINAAEDSDDVVRRAQLALIVGGQAYPSLPLEMARVGLGEDLELALDDDGFVNRVGFAHSKRTIPVNASGTLAINFRGGGYHFPFVSAVDLLGENPIIPVRRGDAISLQPLTGVFKDAYVLIGVTAAGARDLKHFPFGRNIPGTEGLATILDNILAGDPLTTTPPGGMVTLLVLMTAGGVLFGLLMLRLSALPAMLSSLAIIGALAAIDMFWLFGRDNLDLHSVFLLAELATIFIATVAAKYVLEERGKRFIRSTFSKYLAPTVVDQMLEDPSKLQLGGETRRLTIMMSDLRGFTAMAERMKPAEVLTVLNHYLGTMADLIMDYGGTIDEFIGDAILVIFGAPIEAPDDARRAVACGIAMQRAMIAINEHNVRLHLPKLEMGIALNTGEVIVGNIGSQKHIKYGVVGSHVNLTARIESNTVGGQLLISGSTLELAGEHVTVGEKQLIVAKGFPDPIPAFEVKAIGGEFGLEIPEIELGLVELAAPLAVTYRVMKGKNEEGDEHAGQLTSLSALGATLSTPERLDAFANLKLRVTAGPDAVVEGDLYAKVIATGEVYRLRFTAVPPAVAKLIAQLAEPRVS
ncbi:MAG: adenylate/guanylate cyclase domain-containing protein [Kofleriaceae bacterium]